MQQRFWNRYHRTQEQDTLITFNMYSVQLDTFNTQIYLNVLLRLNIQTTDPLEFTIVTMPTVTHHGYVP